MAGRLVIIDFGMGNLNSVKKVMLRINQEVLITSRPEDITKADKIILPGIGHFTKAMEILEQHQLIEPLNEAVLIKKKPILGICLGMQLMAKSSSEGNTRGLGWMDGEVVKFDVSNPIKTKIPHMGWNQISQVRESRLMKDIPDLSEFYFVHSYHWKTDNLQDIINETDYDYIFPSAIEKENIFGVQYHPEKSHDYGEQLLKNFATL